jgi:hypothetical protein
MTIHIPKDIKARYYTDLKAVAVRFEAGCWNPIIPDGQKLERSVDWPGSSDLDHFGWWIGGEKGEVAIQLWGRRLLYRSWFSNHRQGTGPEQWTGRWLEIPTRGFERPRVALGGVVQTIRESGVIWGAIAVAVWLLVVGVL